MDLEIEVIKDTIQGGDCIIRRFLMGFDYTQTPLLASFLVSILRVGGSGGERDDSGKTVT